MRGNDGSRWLEDLLLDNLLDLSGSLLSLDDLGHEGDLLLWSQLLDDGVLCLDLGKLLRGDSWEGVEDLLDFSVLGNPAEHFSGLLDSPSLLLLLLDSQNWLLVAGGSCGGGLLLWAVAIAVSVTSCLVLV